ncbi:MAG: acetyl-CoA carboxylase biotin carboxyl carrier protein [Chitinophagaceae bacterium]|nr:acetyl-CoA carboxylase biotin carboxyl carrier protein [Chitinophagaceae bacterium]
MDFKQIQELIRMINKSNIGEVSIEEKGFKLTIRQKQDQVTQVISSSSAMPSYSPPPAQPQITLPAATATGLEKPKQLIESINPNLVTIKSPMIGTFYRSPSPDKPSFLNVGDEVTVGKVVCIIEAMKLFNEIESEVAGKIVKVLVDDASPVEYDQPLFLVEPE